MGQQQQNGVVPWRMNEEGEAGAIIRDILDLEYGVTAECQVEIDPKVFADNFDRHL